MAPFHLPLSLYLVVLVVFLVLVLHVLWCMVWSRNQGDESETVRRYMPMARVHPFGWSHYLHPLKAMFDRSPVGMSFAYGAVIWTLCAVFLGVVEPRFPKPQGPAAAQQGGRR